jgi:rhodanese-related sulfurtransferase
VFNQVLEFVVNHPYLTGSFAVLLALLVRTEMQRGGPGVSPQELVNLVNKQSALVLDVRDSKAFGAGHIVDAVNIPESALVNRIGELDKYKDKPIAIVCAQGQHAGLVGARLRKAGFEHVSRLTGGMLEWRNQNLPVVKG